MAPLRSTALCLSIALLVCACQRIPEDRYGIVRLRIEGVDEMDATALIACLASQERTREGLTLGLSGSPSCGEPPFDAGRVHIRLWTWPWTDWPLYDEALLVRDLERIIRWYRARGFPNARIVSTEITPESATEQDLVDADTDCERDGRHEGCRARITIVVEEGEPIHVTTVAVHYGEGETHAPEVVSELEGAIEMERGDRFDEYRYEHGKELLSDVLANRGHCHARVEGRVHVLRSALTAEVDYYVFAGPLCRLGAITVEGNADIPEDPILGAAGLRSGELHVPDDITDAQQAVFALGAFGTVEVELRVTEDSEVVPVVIRVTPAPRNRYSVGGGLQVGQAQATTDADGQQVNQWDLHVLARWENRNFLGGLRRIAVEDRVRLISNAEFPRFSPLAWDKSLGNVLTVDFEQPGFIEARTTLKVSALYDVGPDPYAAFFRHALRGGVDLQRSFWRGRIRASVGIHIAAYRVPGSPATASDAQQDWLVSYWEQLLELDLRDRPVQTRSGLYLILRLQEAGFGLPSNWDYLRILPEVRLYAPLPAGMVLAGRFRVGALIGHSNFGDNVAADNPLRLGPDIHRLRGGGPISNRGFLAQRLGDGEAGGIRLWEANAELRVPISENLWIATFADMGDSSRGSTFRFNYMQLSLGAGLRYYTIVGPIRLDVGFRVPGAQHRGPDERILAYCQDDATMATVDCNGPSHRGQIFNRPAGAIHVTLGDAF